MELHYIGVGCKFAQHDLRLGNISSDVSGPIGNKSGRLETNSNTQCFDDREETNISHLGNQTVWDGQTCISMRLSYSMIQKTLRILRTIFAMSIFY